MNLPSLSTTVPAQSPAARETRLSGRWLMLARVAWLGLAACCVTTFAFGVPLLLALPPCSGDTCSALDGPTPQEQQALAHSGLLIAFFAAYIAVFLIFELVSVVMGLLIFARQSAEPRALFFAFFLVAFGNIWLIDPLDAVGANPAWRVPATLIHFLGNLSTLLFGYLFPDGRFVPRWTRWVALALLLPGVATYFAPGSALDLNAAPVWLNTILTLTLYGSIVLAQVYRYRRRSTLVQRQQTKWVLLALSAVLLIYVSAVFIPPNPGLLVEAVVNVLLELALLLLPLAIAISILRYRLWEIDALINKALVYGSLTGLLGALYAGLILGLQALESTLTGQTGASPPAIVLSTLAIWALFLPVRRRIQSVIDRRFYRKKYDAEQTLAAFSATLRNEVDLERVHEQLLSVVQQTMQPAHVSLWLRSPAQDATTPWEPRASGMLAPAPHSQHPGSAPDARQQAPEGGGSARSHDG